MTKNLTKNRQKVSKFQQKNYIKFHKISKLQKISQKCRNFKEHQTFCRKKDLKNLNIYKIALKNYIPNFYQFHILTKGNLQKICIFRNGFRNSDSRNDKKY